MRATRAVLVTPAMPSDRGNGLAMRAGLLLAGLARSCTVSVLYAPMFGPMPAASAYATRLASEVHAFDLARAAAAQLAVVHRTYVLPLLDELLREPGRPRLVLDVDDVEPLDARHLPLVDAVIACSRADADELGAAAVIPNAVRMPALERVAGPRDHDLLLVGNLSYAANVEAALWLCHQVLPRLGDDTRLAIVGSHPVAEVQALGTDPRVTLAADVPDVTPWYARSSIAVVPVQRGGGSRIKLIEALAHRRAVVSTTIGAAGVPWSDEESPVVRADTPEAFARACRDLLEDPARAEALAARGAALVRERASIEAVAPQIERFVRSLFPAAPPPRPLRAAGIEVVPSADGYVVYDAGRDRVHYLNHVAALVLEFATGENSDAEITHMLQVAYDLPESPEREVRECLALLRSEGLVGDA